MLNFFPDKNLLANPASEVTNTVNNEVRKLVHLSHLSVRLLPLIGEVG